MVRSAFLVALKPLYLRARRLGLRVLSAVFPPKGGAAAIDPDMVSQILILCQPRLGDNIMSEPVFRAIKARNSAYVITAFVSRYMADFVREMPAIDRTIADPGRGFLNFLRAVRLLRKTRYDLVVDLTTDYTLRSAFLAFFCKSRFSAGYDIQGRGFLFRQPITPAPQSRHIASQLASLAEAIGIPVQDTVPKIRPTAQALSTMAAFLISHGIRDDDRLIGVHPGGQYPTQRWPDDRFAALCDRLSAEAKVVLVSSKSEAALLAGITEKMASRPAVFLSDTVPDLAACLSRCRLLVCNNSGPLHLAAALGIGTLSTMGPTDPVLWSPLGEKNSVVRKNLTCMPCELGWCRIKTHACMNKISVEEMHARAREILAAP